jgi:hypothetical protein
LPPPEAPRRSPDLPHQPKVVDTGGGALFLGAVHAQEVTGRDRITVGDRGVAVGGSLSGSTIVTGDGNRVELGSNVTLQEFRALLAELRALMPQAGLEERRASILVQDLRLVEEEAGAARPDRALIVTRLKGVTEALKGPALPQEADKMLLPMAEKALAAARNLFP